MFRSACAAPRGSALENKLSTHKANEKENGCTIVSLLPNPILIQLLQPASK